MRQPLEGITVVTLEQAVEASVSAQCCAAVTEEPARAVATGRVAVQELIKRHRINS